jgi:hypothetical protein
LRDRERRGGSHANSWHAGHFVVFANWSSPPSSPSLQHIATIQVH